MSGEKVLDRYADIYNLCKNTACSITMRRIRKDIKIWENLSLSHIST